MSKISAIIAALVLLCMLAAVPVSASESGKILGWGDQVGVDLSSEFMAVSAGGSHSLGLKTDGSVIAWGLNNVGQCSVPSPNTGFTAVAAGHWHSLGLKSDGSIVAWGWNYYRQCSVPPPNTGFVAVAAGHEHSLGLKADGSVVAWGRNDKSQCNVPSPNTGFVAVAAGGEHSVGLKADGSVVTWGNNNYGQCSVPSPNTRFVTVAAGYMCSLGVKADGSVVDNPAIRSAKLQPDGVFAGVYGGVISAAWSDEFYIEADNRTCGILVKKSGHGLAQGKNVNVAGVVRTNADGERYLDTSYVSATPFSGTIKPFGLTNRSLGGTDFLNPATLIGQQGITGGKGLNNIGLLVRVWGRVMEVVAGKVCGCYRHFLL